MVYEEVDVIMNEENRHTVTCSIILPTYNRAGFLPEAIDAIRGQTFTDWELIVVDDGSTDDTQSILAELVTSIEQPVQIVYQSNQGAYAARAEGVRLAEGRYLAFFDSDDLWFDYHLDECIAALEAYSDVDWVYGACRSEDMATGSIFELNMFYVDGRPRDFLKLHVRREGDLRIIDDSRLITTSIKSGIFCGLQTSVFRRKMFSEIPLNTSSEVVGDSEFFIRAAVAGYRPAYFDRVHLRYRVHDGNSSNAASGVSLDKRLVTLRERVSGCEAMCDELPLTYAQRRAMVHRISRDYFWRLGYALLWRHGRRGEAMEMFREGMKRWPTNMFYWKTYVKAWCEYMLKGQTTRVCQ